MDLFVALFVCFGIFAVGDILGVATKAKVSSVFVALLVFLLGFMSGIIPKDIIETSTLNTIAVWSSGYIVFHMGTMINIKQLISEWRTVLLTVLSMLVAGVALLALIPIIGGNMVFAAIPIINGGLIATQIMSEQATAVGATTVAAFAAILYAIQKFVGTPFASFFGLKEAKLIVEQYRIDKDNNKLVNETVNTDEVSKIPFYQANEKYFTDFVCLGISGLFVLISFWFAGVINDGIHSLNIEALTNFKIHYTIVALITGAIVGYVGIVPPKVLEKGKASGLLSVAIFASIIPSLAKIQLSDFASLGLNLILVFAVVLISLIVVFYILPTGKLIGSKNLAVGIAVGQLLGFPATYLISQEIAKAVSDDPEEQAAVMAVISPTYVIAGFASVTTFSIFTAGFLVNFIQ